MALEKITQLKGRGVYVSGDDIDTDRIIPARFMKCLTFEGLGAFLFYDVRKNENGEDRDHNLNKPCFTGASILISGSNFGCGSSREHAPQALYRAGFRAIIAESYAEIFFGNATNLGIACMVASKDDIQELVAAVETNPQVEITVDVEHQKIYWGEGRQIDGSIRETARQNLISGRWDPIAELMQGVDAADAVAKALPYMKNRDSITHSKNISYSTNAVHAGVYVDEQYHSVTTPIYPTSTFYFNGSGDPPPFDYSRCGNPTRQALQDNLNALEGGDRAFAVCSGVTAIHTVLMLLKSGDHVICGHEIYGGSYRLFSRVFSPFGIDFSFVNMCDPEAIAAAVRRETRIIWIETPTNPLLNIVDIQAVVALARKHGILTALDNTFMTPILQRPIELGVDLVVYSTTKYMNGHSDVVGGAIVTRTPELSKRLNFLISAIGVGSAPFDAWLVLRGIKTLPHRMKIHEQNAMAILAFLKKHPLVKRVFYPGLPEHPLHELAKRQQKGFGGMLSLEVDLEKLDLECFFKTLKYFKLSVSLGGVESLIQHPWSMSHAAMLKEARLSAGINEAIVRISAGIEGAEDLIADLENALKVAVR